MARDYIDIDAEEVRELVRDRGERVLLYKALPCSCSQTQDVSEESSESESCPYGCASGNIFTQKVFAEEIADSVGIVTEYNKTVYSPDLGRTPSGTAKWIGMADEVVLGDQDRLTLLDREEIVREVIRHGDSDLDDVLAHPEITQIIELRQGFTTFVEGVDFELAPAEFAPSGLPLPGRILWLDGGNAPEMDSFYSIEYGRHSRLAFYSDGNRPARNNLAGEKLVQRVTLTILPAALASEAE